ncbi:MAG: hypothetical protein OEV93_00930 [Candidatus Moranbacteria bacterium]|nr:hypothetical protein [Candidatus Moranbacteria bacterium]
MYWIYLVLFILIVFIPGSIVGDVGFVGEEKAEEIAIFALGSIVMLLFIFKEKQFRFNLKEKTEIQEDFHKTSQSLSNSYSYIGEANRKLEILRKISLDLANVSKLDDEDKQRIFIAIRDAIKVLSKNSEFVIKFVNTKNKEVIDKIPGYQKSFSCGVERDIKNSFESEKSIVQGEKCIIIKSAGEMDGVVVMVIFRHDNGSLPENAELIQTLATQVLFLYTSSDIKRNVSKIKQ